MMATTFFLKHGNEYHDLTMDLMAVYFERALIINDNEEQYIDSPTESSDAELSAESDWEAKNYYRRSKLNAYQNDEQPTSDSSDTSDEENSDYSHHSYTTSSSQSDNPFSKHYLTDGESEPKLKRFDALTAQGNILQQNDAKMAAKTVRLDKDDLPQIAKNPVTSSVETLESPAVMETLPANTILDLWERSHIPQGRCILLVLGFESDNINLAQLNKAMEEVIPKMARKQQMTLMKACLALQSTEFTTLRKTSKQLHNENLRQFEEDIKRRLALPAAEIGERHHKSVEDEPKKEVRSLEKQHAGVATDDSENLSTIKRALKRSLNTFELDELEVVPTDNEDLESHRHKLKKTINGADELEHRIVMRINKQL